MELVLQSIRAAIMSSANLPPIICELGFGPEEGRVTVSIAITAPAYDSEREEYYCLTFIRGVEGKEEEKIYSREAFGALMLALLRFRVILGRMDYELVASGGTRPHMYFPKEIPWVYGTNVYDRLCAMVDAEVQKIEDDLTRRREADPDWADGD